MQCNLQPLSLSLLGHSKAIYQIHNPYERILQRQFFNDLIVIAYHLYNEEHE